ncbi:MAG: GNAT family N-acetyltransferase [Taibaiella sp.]|nr:GNAT family N-acetyltransferase [Taibaiella sp.]
MTPIHFQFGDYTVTTDKTILQPRAIHEWLSVHSYWAMHIPYNSVKTSFDNSYTIGVLFDGKQVAYARLVTDYSSFAYLADVYVVQDHRGKGLSKIMMQTLMDIDWVKNLRRILLATVDAKKLYEQYGFVAPKYPDRLMEIIRPAIYGDDKNPCS